MSEQDALDLAALKTLSAWLDDNPRRFVNVIGETRFAEFSETGKDERGFEVYVRHEKGRTAWSDWHPTLSECVESLTSQGAL